MKTVFYGWIVTAGAFVILFLTYGVQYSFGIFVPAMADDLGWPRASLGGAFSLYSVVYTCFTLLSGRLTDALGPRCVIGVGGLLLGGGLMATSQMHSVWQLFVFYGVIAALGMSTAYIPCNMTVVRWFRRRRGLALGLASCGASCGILSVPLLAAVLIAAVGWRAALLGLAAGIACAITLVAPFMLRGPEQLGLLPDGAARSAHAQAAAAESGWRFHEARTTAAFWILLAAFAATMVTVGVPFVHLASFAADLGLRRLDGALLVSVIGLFALGGNLGLGAVSDRIGRKPALVLAYAAQVVAFALFYAAGARSGVFLGAAAFGIFYGGFAALFPALVGDLFGPAHAGTIGGFIIAGGGILGAWGPALTGWLRDVDGNYVNAFGLCLGVAVLALILYLLLPRTTPR